MDDIRPKILLEAKSGKKIRFYCRSGENMAHARMFVKILVKAGACGMTRQGALSERGDKAVEMPWEGKYIQLY